MKFLWVLNDKNEKLHSIFCSSRLPVLAMETHKITRQLNEWIDPSQTYQILKHYYQYLPHTSNPNQIPRRYQRKLPTNLSLWTATCWRGSICCTAVTQTKSRDMLVRDLRRLDSEALPKIPDCSSQKRTGASKCFDNISWMFLSKNLQHIASARFSKAFIPATCAFREIFAPYFGFWRVAAVSRFWASPKVPLLQKKTKKKNTTNQKKQLNNNTCYTGC